MERPHAPSRHLPMPIAMPIPILPHPSSVLLSLLLLVIVIPVTPSHAFSVFSVRLPARDKACFYETMERNERLDVTYQVGAGGDLEIDFWVQSPDTRLIYTVFRQPTATFGFDSDTAGRHSYCFSNVASGADKIVTFTVQGSEERESLQKRLREESGAGMDEEAKKVDEEVAKLAESLRGVRDEQVYMQAREAVHRRSECLYFARGELPFFAPTCAPCRVPNDAVSFPPHLTPHTSHLTPHTAHHTPAHATSHVLQAAESTNTRVLVWSLAETALLVSVCVWQVWYLRRFFEVKRVV
ncbi:p24 complex component [Gonapodya sp. JEL0774]|nr:p24 complex component [Gonapodya sp. JEL0774]